VRELYATSNELAREGMELNGFGPMVLGPRSYGDGDGHVYETMETGQDCGISITVVGISYMASYTRYAIRIPLVITVSISSVTCKCSALSYPILHQLLICLMSIFAGILKIPSYCITFM
jgi:hypothetical protein